VTGESPCAIRRRQALLLSASYGPGSYGCWFAIKLRSKLSAMAEIAHDGQHDFWRPPVVQPDQSGPAMVEVCDRCGTEFMPGSRFCHACGAGRQSAALAQASRWTQQLEFHNIKQGLGLSTISLIAFVIGMACVLGCIACGVIYSERNVLEWEAVQLYRIQWLLGAAVSFVAGILLKRRSR